jgi:hypothetical protein
MICMVEISGYDTERGLIEGLHGTKDEIHFVQDVISGIIKPAGYTQKIRLIGSRAENKWISKFSFLESCGGLPEGDQQYWYKFLNTQAHKHKLNRGQIRLLAQDLPSNAPSEISQFLTAKEQPGSDFDLLLIKRPKQLEYTYEDMTYGTGQQVDIVEISELDKSQHSSLY